MSNAETRSITPGIEAAGGRPLVDRIMAPVDAVGTLNIYTADYTRRLFSLTVPLDILLVKSRHVHLSVMNNYPSKAYSLRPVGRRRARRAATEAKP
jgi:hypothetical protein